MTEDMFDALMDIIDAKIAEAESERSDDEGSYHQSSDYAERLQQKFIDIFIFGDDDDKKYSGQYGD